MCNCTWGLVVRTPAARGRAGDVSETYYDRYVHQGCRWGADRDVLWVRFLYEEKEKCEYLFTPTVTSSVGGSEWSNVSFQPLRDTPA